MATLANLLAVQFLSGVVFFVGLATACAGVAGGVYTTGRRARFSCRVVAAAGAILVLASATPLPLWVYAGWCLAWMAGLCVSPGRRAALSVVVALCAASAAMAAFEAPYHRSPEISTVGCQALYVVGDSLTQGARTPGRNWPDLLGEKIKLKTFNLGIPGAKVEDGAAQADRIGTGNVLVLLEIGGNNLLDDRGGFEKGLDVLLSRVCRPGRRVAMVELPLPPTFNRFGAAQRRMARKYGVTLVPKRFLAGVLGSPGATEDGLHLSNDGHALLAGRLCGLFSGEA